MGPVRIVLLLILMVVAAMADPAPAEPVAGEEPSVRVLDTGREPRRKLRLHPRPGDRQELSISMALSLGMAFGDRPVSMRELPGIILPFTVRVLEVRANGDIGTEFRCGKVEVLATPGTDPMMVDMMKAICAGVEGVSGTSLVTARGITLRSSLSIPENMDPGAKVVLAGMGEAMGRTSFPLPEEAVGAGAKWQVTSRLPDDAGSAEQRATWTLVSLEGDRFTVTSASAIRAGEGIIPTLAGQEPLRRRSLESMASAVMMGDLSRVAPAETVLESSILERIEVKPNAVMTRRTAVRSRMATVPETSVPAPGR
ncbi:MAG: hypothetical protein MUE73_17450 [Planctomycetes bacterium]|jgi:hypothetical protein|nr:hypothetical protein [Planctomycetota bacterium]